MASLPELQRISHDVISVAKLFYHFVLDLIGPGRELPQESSQGFVVLNQGAESGRAAAKNLNVDS